MKSIFNNYLNNKIKLDKYQFVGVIALIIVMAGVFGWVYEFVFYYFDDGMKRFYYQGGNFLPWINIYAIGALLIIYFTRGVKKSPLLVFIISMIVTGLLEYFSGYVILKFFGMRLWDYNKEILNFGNVGGFICFRSVLFFGLSALVLMYGLLPFSIYLSTIMNKRRFMMICVIMCGIILFDEVYNLIIARVFNWPRAFDIYRSIGFK